MARMRTGRLTKMTTPPQKPIVSTKPGVSNVSNQAEWDKYGADYKAYKNYDNEVKDYNKQMDVYKKQKLQGSPDYRALDAGNTSSKNMRSLDASELAEFNAAEKKNNPDSPNYSWVKVSKDTQRGKWGNFMGDVAKPTAPTKKDKPKVPELTGTMNILKPELIKGRKTLTKKKTTENPAFVYPEKDIKNKYGRQLTPGGDGVVRAKYKPGAALQPGKAIKGSKTINERKYNREKDLFRAKAGTGVAGLDISDLSSKDIKGIRKDYLRNDLRTAKKDLSVSPEVRAKNIASAKMEIQQSRKGQRYTKKQEKGKLSYFVPDKIQEYKFSQDNATNRNTIQEKLNKIGQRAKEKASKGSFGEMPMRG